MVKKVQLGWKISATMFKEKQSNKYLKNQVSQSLSPRTVNRHLENQRIEYNGEDPKTEPDMTCEAGSTAWIYIENNSTMISLAGDGGVCFITLWNMNLMITLLCKQQE